jgi:hypothetical protein
LHRFNYQDHAECPRCAEFEDIAHVVKCQAPRATAQWEASLSQLAEWLVKAKTMPDLRKAIITQLTAWRNNDEPPLPQYNWPGVNDLITKQSTLGWRNFLEGGVLQEWAAKQQAYYNWLNRKNTGRRWITTLIKKLWEISWNMWEQRNGELRNPESSASLREHARLDAAIAHEYTDLASLALKDRRWFRRTKEIIFTETVEYKQQWIESVSSARARYIRRHRHRTHLQAQRTAMRNYLRPNPPSI